MEPEVVSPTAGTERRWQDRIPLTGHLISEISTHLCHIYMTEIPMKISTISRDVLIKR